MEDKLMTVEELAEYLTIPKQTIYRWRTEGHGPRAIKVGRHLRFRSADVETWLNSQADQ
jgi:excisionase family DNA binding protein